MKLIAFLCFPLFLAAQVKGVARDAQTGKPIPYVNVWVLKENIGMTGDSLGNYTVGTTNADKTIVFSAGGYETLKVKLPETRKVVLKPIASTVENASIPEEKIVKEYEDYKKKEIKLTYASKGMPWIMAKYFPGTLGTETAPFLRRVTLMTDCVQENATFRLRIMAINEDGTPGNDLVAGSILVHPEKGKKDLEIDLSKYRLRYPKTGIFVGVEWLIFPENVRNRRERFLPGPKLYDPSIGAIPDEKNTTWVYALGQWNPFSKSGVTGLKEFKGQYVELAINLTFSN
jgi:hypothetical protein